MTDQPIHDDRLLEAIEACRPGSDDVADPALADLAAALAADGDLENLYQRMQQVDATLAAGFRDVPVPEGLQQRLLDALAATGTKEVVAADDELTTTCDVSQPSTLAAAGQRRFSRRWLLAAGVATSTVAASIAVYWLSMTPAEPCTTEMVLGEAIEFFINETGDGVEFANREASGNYPVGRAVKTSSPPWRSIRGFWGRRGAAYDLSRGGIRATLYVLTGPVADLPVIPPTRPQHTTQGCSTAAWLEDGLMYVLVVGNGDPQVLRSFLWRRPIA